MCTSGHLRRSSESQERHHHQAPCFGRKCTIDKGPGRTLNIRHRHFAVQSHLGAQTDGNQNCVSTAIAKDVSKATKRRTHLCAMMSHTHTHNAARQSLRQQRVKTNNDTTSQQRAGISTYLSRVLGEGTMLGQERSHCGN